MSEYYQSGNYSTDSGDTWVVGGAIQYPNLVTLTEDTTLTPEDSGKTFRLNAADLVVTLPATQEGLLYIFVVTAASAVTGASISPQAADKFVSGAKADDADLVNTQATEAIGDNVTVQGDGIDGWFILSQRGTWA
jgi:hypothetical protein